MKNTLGGVLFLVKLKAFLVFLLFCWIWAGKCSPEWSIFQILTEVACLYTKGSSVFTHHQLFNISSWLYIYHLLLFMLGHDKMICLATTKASIFNTPCQFFFWFNSGWSFFCVIHKFLLVKKFWKRSLWFSFICQYKF